MRKNNSEDITAVLQRFMRQYGLETPLNQRRLMSNWNDIVGPVVARQTESLQIRNQTLVVKITSPVLRSELKLKRKTLVNQLNDSVKAQVIEDIQIF